MQELQLRFFTAVARTGSLSAAAEQLHVAVSAVSRQISNLEDGLGLQLFERRPRGMHLTEPGEILLAYATRNMLEVKNVLAEMRGLNTLQQHVIKLACPEGMAWHFLPRVMAAFRGFHPGATFDVQVVDAAQASALVKDGVVDIALTFSLTPIQGVEIAMSIGAPIGALMHGDHPLANRAELTVADLADHPLALSPAGSTMRYLFDIACNLRGFTIVPVLTSASLGTIYTMVAQSRDVIALCGAVTVHGRPEQDDLVFVPLADPQMSQRSLQVQVMAGRKMPVLIRYFLSFLEEQLTTASRG